jgi:P4 family phage/plasmid primase-like protien
MQRQAYACDREAIKKAGFPPTPVYCGWEYRPRPGGGKPDKVKDVHGKPGSRRWRRMEEVEPHPAQGDMLGVDIHASGLTCLDADDRSPAYRGLIEALPCWEASVSGKGTHLFTRAAVPADCPQQWYKDGHRLEVYGANSPGRFIALTGRYLRGKRELEDVLDTPPDLVARLVAEGWAPGVAAAKAGPVALPADLPRPPRLGELDAWAAMLDGRHRDDPRRGDGPWGVMGPAKQSRWAAMAVLMDRAALLVGSPAELASWWFASFPTLIGARGGGPDHAADRDREVSRAWAGRPGMPDDVSRETLAADFGEAVMHDGDTGGNAAQAVAVLAIPDEQLARDMLAEFEERGGGIMHAPGLGKSYFLEPRSGLWLADKDGKFVREIYTYNRTRAEAWLNDNPGLPSRVARSVRNDHGGTGRKSRVRTALQAYAGVAHDRLDTDPLLVGMVDGVYDIEADRMRPARLDEYVTMTTEVAPDPRVDTPNFRIFLESVFRHDLELIGFMQRWIGYCLTGLTTEQKIVFAWGKGQNGKSTFFEIIKEMLGTYAKKIAAEALMQRKQDVHASEIAQLMGARFILATEISEAAAWNEGRLKELSGGDTINANFMRQDKIEFPMYGKVNIAGNHKPRMNGTDFAMIRRMCLVPFIQQFEGKQVDPDMKDKLRAEKRGILWWAVQGVRVWRRNGLLIPASVLEASSEYFTQEDMVAEWIKNYCEPGPDFKTPVRDVTRSLNSFLSGIGRQRHYSPVQVRAELIAKGYTVQEGKARMQFLYGFKLAHDGETAAGLARKPDYGQDG